MSDTNGRAVDTDGDPLFEDEVPVPRYPLEAATIEARSPEGFKVTWTLNDPVPGAVSRRIAAMMKQNYTPTTDAPAPARASHVSGGQRTVKWETIGGERCCPLHRKALKEGDFGPYCSAKAKDGEIADKKGYCGLKFEAP